MSNLADKLAGVILGTAVGDALGVPRENLSPARARRLFGDGPLRHHLIFGRGMVSDDTEHTCMTAQALLAAPDDAGRFARSLAWRFRFWFLGLPAGVGLATLRACLKLWLGFPPSHSGVYSAGNGPAMRAAILGACLGGDPERVRACVRASTQLTHTDPRAERGALLVALAAHFGMQQGPGNVTVPGYLRRVRESLTEPDNELAELLARMEALATQGEPVSALAEALGQRRGVSGYIYRSVPIALYAWLRAPGDWNAVEQVIRLGGDTDSTGAIVGGLVGATAGAGSIPNAWLSGLLEWPRTIVWMHSLGQRLAEQFGEPGAGGTPGPLPLFWPGIVPRNLFFLAIVLAHGFRRLGPPY